jgi:two-component system chemotaxis response regulator CheY
MSRGIHQFMKEKSMRILLAEDDYVTRKFMTNFLSKYGECDVTVDGMEAVDAFMMAMEEGEPYDLVCLDIMMPVMDGYQALMGIRNVEKDHNIPEDEMVKVIMTTALNDEKNVKMAFDLGCSVYSGKPIDQERFEQALKKLGLI